MASIRDVAKKAGVASCTVSRLLNGTATVAPETQKKIEDAMKNLDYVPNELARGMFKGRSQTIAMLVPNIQHPWFSSLASEIEKNLYGNGYKMMMFSTTDDAKRERECFQILKSNIVDGIICGTSACDMDEYLKVKKPMVMLDFKIGKKFPVVASDHDLGAKLAANVFIQNKCKNVIHISGMKHNGNIMSFLSHEKLDSLLEKAGIKSRRIEIIWNDFDFEGYYALAKNVMDKHPEVDGIMAADLPAAAFLKAANAMGKKIPGELAIVSYDGTFITKTCTTEMTTICQPYEAIAKKSVEILMKMMHQTKEEADVSNEILLPVSLVKGATTL